jgi:hypothetical protein
VTAVVVGISLCILVFPPIPPLKRRDGGAKTKGGNALFKSACIVLAATVLVAPAAMAQTPAPAPAAAPAAPADADLKAFAQSLVAIEKLRTAPGGLTQPAMLEAVQKSGVDPAKFNEFSNRMRTDPAFNQQVQAAVREVQAAAAPATPAPPTGA